MIIEVFVSYAHEDSVFFEKYQLIPRLEHYLEKRDVAFWWDTKISPGQRFAEKIKERIRRAHIAILLISRGFTSSEFINQDELPLILERAAKDELVILPILVRPCPWRKVQVIKDLQMLPRSHGVADPEPLIHLVNDEAAWDDMLDQIANHLEALVDELTAPSADAPAPPQTPPPADLAPKVPTEHTEVDVEEITVAGWPPSGWFTPDAAHVWRKAAGVAAVDGDMLTSAHLCWALLSVEGPLAAWMRACEYPLEEARGLMSLFISGSGGEGEPRAELSKPPVMSDTVEGVWQWAKDHAEQPLTLKQLTAEFARVQGRVSGELLSWLQVDLSAYPNIVKRLELSVEAKEVFRAAREAARWNGLQITTTHLYYGVLAAGDNALCSFIESKGLSCAEELERMRGELWTGEPVAADLQETRSLNVIRTMAEAERHARGAGHAKVTVNDILVGAAALEAGALGSALKEMGFDPSAGTAVLLTMSSARLVELATRCAHHVGHGVIGTPHFLAAALQEHEALRRACKACGYRADDVKDVVLQALGLPPGEDAFAPVPGAAVLPVSPNAEAAARRAKRSCGEGPVTVDDLLAAILSHADGRAAVVLQRAGFEPHLLLRELQQ